MHINSSNIKIVVLHRVHSLQVTYIGSCLVAENMTLHNVLLVSEFQYNLISVSRLCRDLSCSVVFTPDMMTLEDHSNGKNNVIGKRKARLYVLHPRGVCSNAGQAMQTFVNGRNLQLEKMVLWHMHFGHLPFNQGKSMKKM